MANTSVEKYQPGAKHSIIKASFDLEASKSNYQQLLQSLSSVTVTNDNVNDDLTKDGREALAALVSKKETEAAEPLQWHRDVMAVFKDLSEPLKEQIDRINAQKKIVATKIAEDTAKQVAEQTRINNAKKSIIDFTNKVATMISAATEDTDIVSIEKMIGLEKTKKNVYQEFLPDLITQCDGLRPQIKTQKDNIRNLKKLQEQEQQALSSGNIYEATALREQKEQVEAVIQETGIRIHEKAFEQATTIDIIAPEVADVAPKGRTNWKWRVDDIKLLQKKMPHLVKLVPDEEAIGILLKSKKVDGSLDGKAEETLFGLTFFNDKTFTR